MARLAESLEDSSPSSAALRPSEPWFSVEAYGVHTDSPVVVVHGEVDVATAPELAVLVTEILEKSPRSLVFDLTNMTFIGAAGVRVVTCAGQALPIGRAVVLLRPQPFIRLILEATGVAGLCVIED